MRSVRGVRCWAGWLGVIAVLGNVLAGALCYAPARAATPVDEVLGALSICTADGAHTQPAGGGQNPSGKSDHCAACTLLAGFALIVAAIFAAIAFPPTLVFQHPRLGLRTLADHLSLGGIRSRAPPAFA